MQSDLDAAYLYLDTAEDVAWTIRHEQRQAEARDTLRGIQLLSPHEPKAVQLREKMLARQN